MEYLPSYKNNLYLAHHGIKGQKWGVRRYQNPDGSLTPEGKKRVNKYTETGAEIGASIGLVGGMFTPQFAGMPITTTLGSVAGGLAGEAIGKGVVSGKINKKLGIKIAKGAAITTGLVAGSYGALLLSDEIKANRDFAKSKVLADTLVSKHLSDLLPNQQDIVRTQITNRNNDILKNQRIYQNRARRGFVKDAYDAYINPETRSFEARTNFGAKRRNGYYKVRTGDFNDIGMINESNFNPDMYREQFKK